MSDSLFEAIFGRRPGRRPHHGEPSVFEAVFGAPASGATPAPADLAALTEESLFTELLTELAGKGILSNEDARAVIERAKERAKAKAESKPCPCPRCDTRPHKALRCARCEETQPHLIEGETARCRRCLTVQAVPSA